MILRFAFDPWVQSRFLIGLKYFSIMEKNLNENEDQDLKNQPNQEINDLENQENSDGFQKTKVLV